MHMLTTHFILLDTCIQACQALFSMDALLDCFLRLLTLLNFHVYGSPLQYFFLLFSVFKVLQVNIHCIEVFTGSSFGSFGSSGSFIHYFTSFQLFNFSPIIRFDQGEE